MRRVLVTGFDAVKGDPRNPSAVIAQKLGEIWPGYVAAAIIPTSYTRSWPMLRRLIEAQRPQALVMLGVASRPVVNIELRAQNRSSTTRRDNDGLVGPQVIIPPGRPEYPTTLPVEAIARQLRAKGLPYERSYDAGDFLCNYLFYRAQHYASGQSARLQSGFIHVPSAATLRGTDPTLTAGATFQAVKTVVELLLED